MDSLKLLEVTFTNFSRIYSGLGKTRLHIDFSHLTNKIYLFVGDNGTGKTSIMRALHPFAYNNGAGDNTANADFIIEGKDGKKEISYAYGDNRYDIVHIYTRKKDNSISVKSFIQKDGKELNESGTVKTFKELILQIFGLDEAYLGLLSLGNTIDGFVKYTSANRKRFAIQIFSQLNMYNKYYKTARVKVRDTKSILANIATKLEKYKMYDLTELEEHRLSLEATILKKREELDVLMVNIGGVLQIIQENDELIKKHDEKRKTFNDILDNIDRLKSKVSTKKDLITLRNDLEKISENINDLKVTISGIEVSISSALDLKDSKVSTMKSLQENLSRMSNSIDVKELTELLASLKKELSSITSTKLPRRPQWSKEDLIKINIYLDELTRMCVDLVNDVDDLSIIPEILKDYLKNNEIDLEISQGLEELTYAYNQEKMLCISKSLLENIHVRKIKSSCDNKDGCQYVKFYHNVMDVINGHALDTDDQLRARKNEIRDVKNKLTAANIIKRLYKFIDMNRSYFEVPLELFDPSNFILQYLDRKTIYDSGYLSYIIELEETYEKKLSLEESIKDTEHKLSTLSDTTELYNKMSLDVDKLKSNIADIDSMIQHQRNDLEYNTKELEKMETVKREVQKQVDLLQQLEDARNEFKIVKNELAMMESQINTVKQAMEKNDEYSIKRASIEKEMRGAETHLRNTQVTITSIMELQREQKQLIEQYTKDELILEAVSPTSGIPLDFINYYIKEEMITKVNNLLDTVYHGKLRLVKSKTIINEDEFTIPYMKRNTLVSDISKASDGEKAIISLAFSLVLLNITSGPYNILLLDEMDTTLDTVSRAKYIELLEQFMKTIKAEQLFLISHNSMFDVYPVNVLLTSRSSVATAEGSQVLDLVA